MKDIIRRIPPLIFGIRLLRTGLFTGHELMERLAQFVPLSEGPQRFRVAVTMDAATRTVLMLAELAEHYHGGKVEVLPVEDMCTTDEERGMAGRLAERFKAYGSDKSTSHNYEYLYGRILAGREERELAVLEVGLGTNNTSVLSNMGAGGRPGASLRAFRDILQRARVYGADIDKEVLFEEERIRTHYVDQLDSDTFEALYKWTGENGFDLIIDDGLHVTHANLGTLLASVEKLKNDGWFVVEDISEPSLPVWTVVKALVENDYDAWVLRARGGYMFAMTRKRA